MQHGVCYDFDLDGEGEVTKDTHGDECATVQEMQRNVMRLLVEVATHPNAHSDF